MACGEDRVQIQYRHTVNLEIGEHITTLYFNKLVQQSTISATVNKLVQESTSNMMLIPLERTDKYFHIFHSLNLCGQKLL